MKLSPLYLLLFSLLSVQGCVSSVPSNNVDFACVSQIGELCGSYKNLGKTGHDSKTGSRKVYLSMLFWRTLDEKKHASITCVEISLKDKSSLSIKGVGESGVVQESVFVQGKDFELEGGKIHLKSGWISLVPFKIVGVAHGSSFIGLDQRKDGKYKERMAGGGLIASFIPIAFAVSDEVRFERLGETSETRKTCNAE